MPGKSPILFFSNEPSSLKCCSGFVFRSAHHFIAALKPAYENLWWMRGGEKASFCGIPIKGISGAFSPPDSFLSLDQSSLHEFLEQQLRRHGDGVDGDAGRVEDGVAERRGRTDERRLAERLVAIYA